MRPLVRKLNLLLDWDSTLTKHDTLAVFIFICHAAAQKPSNAPNQSPNPWAALSAAYVADYTVHSTHYRPVTAKRKTQMEEFAWLASLEPIEHASWTRAIMQVSSVPMSDFQRGVAQAIRSKEVELRSGWDSLVDAIFSSHNQVKMAIVSVHWSETFIQTCLLESARIAGLSNSVADFLRDMRIHSNELLSAPANGGMHTSAEKAAVVRSFLDESATTVYVGDSATDLECLLLADVGICIRDKDISNSQAELTSTLARLNIPTRPLSEFLAIPGSANLGSNANSINPGSSLSTIFHVTSLHEIPPLIHSL